MGIQDRYDKMATRQNYKNLWHTSLTDAIGADFPYCLLAAICPACVSYKLRERALRGDMSRYECCGGYMPCSGRCGERNCPQLCLCAEVCCCFSNSVASTRFLLQDEFNIQTTKCDNCIIGFMLCLGQVACIFHLVAVITGSDELQDASEILSCLSDCVYCSYTQHKIEMDKRDGKFGPPTVMMVPPVQQMSRIDHPVPPTVGYAPQPRPLQPPYGGHSCPPPPHIPGYSATAHPPPPPGYPAAGCAIPPPGYFPHGCPPPTQQFPSGGYPLPPPRAHPHPQPHPHYAHHR
ncbi:hypothetical protein COLO4_12740 [Corchorus olitorius]|uniref:PLAC8 family protein n=1 Tax=Corchorus olitorius TaxID=93759 RepID=A0A1R3JZY4_9ROSI|nr:hypothetical protein COLO4_12740 [Corchorus olitorius]